MKGVAALLIALAPAAVMGACRTDLADGASEPVPVCEVEIAPPAGMEPLETFRERFADHVGVRLGFRDPRGRELHAFAGIPGEFGEGLPAAGEVELVQGRTGLLTGSDRVWVVEWTQGGPCDPRAALGNGFGREGFLDVLRSSGIAAASG